MCRIPVVFAGSQHKNGQIPATFAKNPANQNSDKTIRISAFILESGNSSWNLVGQ
jgi:hypothetical protein